jgi:hypothetical protein
MDKSAGNSSGKHRIKDRIIVLKNVLIKSTEYKSGIRLHSIILCLYPAFLLYE